MPRIVIVGAGLSGLATAHYLVKSLSDARKEAEILLLEDILNDRLAGQA